MHGLFPYLKFQFLVIFPSPNQEPRKIIHALNILSEAVSAKTEHLPPDTGASIKTAPIFSAAAAISLETAGSMVLESIRREPFFTFLSNKNNTIYTFNTIHVSIHVYLSKNQDALEDAIGSSVHFHNIGTGGKHGDNAVSLICYLCRTVHNLYGGTIMDDGKYSTKLKKKENSLWVCSSYTCAPSSCTSLQDSGNTSVAMIGYPCFSKFFAIGLPIFPKPMNPTGVFEAIDLEDTTT